jgi:hypothetical protein
MRRFGIESSAEVAKVNQSIERKVRELEVVARELRIAENKTVLGREKLIEQEIMAEHTPRERD